MSGINPPKVDECELSGMGHVAVPKSSAGPKTIPWASIEPHVNAVQVAMEGLRTALAGGGLQAVAPAERTGGLSDANLPCGHPASLLLRSAETGEPLYCELCDDKSGRRDAETMERELRAKVADLEDTVRHLSAALREEIEAPTFDPEGLAPKVMGARASAGPDAEEGVSREWCATYPASAAGLINQLARRLDAIREAHTPPDADAIYDAIEQVLMHHHLSYTVADDEDQSGLPLVDALTTPGAKDVTSGHDEVRLICDAIYNDDTFRALTSQASAAAPAPEPDR